LEKAIEIKRRAQRCVQNGDLDGALREYEKLVETPESDPYNFVLLADLLYKKGEQGRAAERYLNGVTAYEKAGLYKNAIAVCKKMMRLSLSQAQVLRHLAELHALDGLTSEASIYFSQYAEHMVRANSAMEAAAALRKAFDNGQENVKLLEQMSEVLLLEGEDVKAAAALREAAGHWRTRGQESDARRCHERANKLDPSGATRMVAPAPDPTAGRPRLALPATPAAPPAAPAAAPPARKPAPAAHEPDRPASAPSGFTRDLPFGRSPGPVEPDPPPALDPGPGTRPGSANQPPPESGLFERAPRFVAPPGGGAATGSASSRAAARRDAAPEEEESAPEAGVYEIRPGEDAPYESAVSAVGGPAPAAAGEPTPSLLARRPEGLLEGVSLVEHLLQRAQEEFRAGDREKASQALVEAALTYEKLGKLDSAATIFRSLGRAANSRTEVMKLWLANCERRNDRAEGSLVACELGDRALNDGQQAQARAWFEHAAAIDPGNDTARRRLARLTDAPGRSLPPGSAGSALPAETGRVAVALGRGQAMSFDLTGLLQEFQRGVESQLDGDAQGHYDLGMAYREMGLHAQAIEAFQIAVRDARLAGRAHEMIGRCQADRGSHEDAVPEFNAALGRPGLDGAGEAELRYHLALSLAAVGEHASAVQQLELADRRYPGRNDVVERLAEWRRTFGKAA